MTISDETLMAFTDGELSGEEREAVERAIRENPDIEQRVARHRALRERIKLAYSAELTQPVPERLLATARRPPSSAPSGKVVSLQGARAAMARQAARSEDRAANDATTSKAGWWPLGSIAAGLLLGLGLGYGLWQQGGGEVARTAAGTLIAVGPLKTALSAQLVAEQKPDSRVHIGISFRAKSGEYCRSFALSGKAAPAGVACQQGGDWQIQTLMQPQSAETAGEYRTAGAAMPPLLLKSIETQIQGEPLDPSAESAARQRGWKAAAQ